MGAVVLRTMFHWYVYPIEMGRVKGIVDVGDSGIVPKVENRCGCGSQTAETHRLATVATEFRDEAIVFFVRMLSYFGVGCR